MGRPLPRPRTRRPPCARAAPDCPGASSSAPRWRSSPARPAPPSRCPRRRSSRSDPTTSRTRSSCSRGRRPRATPNGTGAPARAADHLLAERRQHDEVRAQEEPDPRRQPARARSRTRATSSAGREPGLRRRTSSRSLVRSDAVSFVRHRRRGSTADLDGMYVLGGDQTVAHERRPRHAARGGDDRRVPGGRGLQRQQRRRRRPVARHDQRLLPAANGPAESLRQGAVQVCKDSGPTDCQGGMPFGFAEPDHRPARVRVRPHRPLAQRGRLDGQARARHGRGDRRGRHQRRRILRDVTGDTLGYVIDPDRLRRDGRRSGAPTTRFARATSPCTSCRPAPASPSPR